MPLLACGQFRATPSPLKNLTSCTTLIHLAHRARASLLFLPEASDYIAPTPAETISLAQPVEESLFVNGLRRVVREVGMGCVVGVHEPVETRSAGVGKGETGGYGRVRNVCLYIDEKGDVRRRYQKVHVFDVDIEGGPRIKESSTTEPGSHLTPPFPTPLHLHLGLQICFDVRFPEPSLSLLRQGAHLLSYPSAFTLSTGRAGHWSTLLRARAIETQSYVVGAALIGEHCPGRASWGEAMIVGPWGEVLGKCESWDEVVKEGRGVGEGDGGGGMERICTAEVDRGVVERVRREVPLKRRFDVYPEV